MKKESMSRKKIHSNLTHSKASAIIASIKMMILIHQKKKVLSLIHQKKKVLSLQKKHISSKKRKNQKKENSER